MIRLSDLPHLTAHAPRTWAQRAVHLDPDLTSKVPTYGDNCATAARAYSLRRARPGDTIVFLARLHPRRGGAAFYLVGQLDIEDAITEVRADPGPGWWDGNAHVRRARATGEWNGFAVFKGGRQSRFFDRAMAFRRREAAQLFGDTWSWPGHRTELQTIGSHTRAVRRVEGTGEDWLKTVCRS